MKPYAGKQKISVITLHRVVNYGSVLQAYALQQVFEKMGFEAELADYYPERLTMPGMLKRIKNKSPLLNRNVFARTAVRFIVLFSYIKRFYIFKQFLRQYMKLTEACYKKDNDFNEYPVKADIYCTGSDQVWNSIYNECVDRPFYLSYAPDNKPKIAYAASFGRETLEDWEEQETRELLTRYGHISMREASGVQVLNRLKIDNGTHVLDPTLLLSMQDWQPLISDKYAGRKYIFVYNANHEKAMDAYAKRLSKEKNLPVFYLSYMLHDFYKGTRFFHCPGVTRFLGLIAHAEYIITDSFHCTAFALNFSKQLLVYYPHKYSTRLHSLVELAGITDNVICEGAPVGIADNPIDHDHVGRVLAEQRQLAGEYLNKAAGLA